MKLSKILLFTIGLSSAALFAQQMMKYDIMVTSAAVPVLYRNCANDVCINVPDLCNDYQPICASSTADIQPFPDSKRKFRVVPKGIACEIAVANQTEKGNVPLGNLKFRVLEPPVPAVIVKLNGTRYFPQMPMPKGSKVSLLVEPDEEFEALVPNDAKYRFRSIEIYTQTGTGVPQKVGAFCGNDGKDATQGVDIPIPSDALRSSGARIYVEYGLSRVNFRGQTFDVGIERTESSLIFIAQ